MPTTRRKELLEKIRNSRFWQDAEIRSNLFGLVNRAWRLSQEAQNTGQTFEHDTDAQPRKTYSRRDTGRARHGTE